MYKFQFKIPFVFILIFVVLYGQIVPIFADVKKRELRVAFIGIKVKAIPTAVEEKILNAVTQAIKQEPSLFLLDPVKVEETIGIDQVSEYLEHQDRESLLGLAKKLQVDYIFIGQFSNNSRDQNRILLDGEIKRFHRHTRGLLAFKVLTYFKDFETELVKFYKAQVNTLMPATETGNKRLRIWPLVAIGGLAVVGILSFNTLGQTGNRDREGPDPQKK